MDGIVTKFFRDIEERLVQASFVYSPYGNLIFLNKDAGKQINLDLHSSKRSGSVMLIVVHALSGRRRIECFLKSPFTVLKSEVFGNFSKYPLRKSL
ncbi:hypothetical protein [Thermococcus stetteri]|uniref:hypothetical protein n=1 Tax=Thermococcus stetteri TaxID=49900 RepID=UPI001AE5C3DE|nr:hypothetical protein [Thermococcus stetteri]MBP1912619.1 hypothetical protein [Thermococcus stetteri]